MSKNTIAPLAWQKRPALMTVLFWAGIDSAALDAAVESGEAGGPKEAVVELVLGCERAAARQREEARARQQAKLSRWQLRYERGRAERTAQRLQLGEQGRLSAQLTHERSRSC